MGVIPFDIGRALSSANPMMRQAAEAGLVKLLERRAVNHGVPIGGEMTLVYPDHARRVNVLLTESGSEVTLLHGSDLEARFLHHTGRGSAQDIMKKTEDQGDWRGYIQTDEWHRLEGTALRLPPAFPLAIAKPGVTSPRGCSLLPLPGRRQDRRRLEPVMALRLQRLWDRVRGNGSAVSYVENAAVGVSFYLTPYGIHFRILQRADATLMLTGVLNSPIQRDRGLLDIRTWKKGFEEAFLSNEPWSLSVFGGAVV